MKAYTIIRSEEQYWMYCSDLEKLTNEYRENPSDELHDLIETITLLIEKYDEAHATLKELDPIQLLKSLMEDNHMKQRDLAQLLAVSKGHVSDILNYKKGLSKNVIRLLSDRFKVRQDAFNRAYELFQVSNKQNGNAEPKQVFTQK
ncbi:helix-turn-helix domain-containing protein [Cyclobacterium salsum]|uniref:helix-turn-helix domain-containing protein n=1 Tax=Cyclobacterium salsum TaxID=2666329 RepID=UPI001391C504|nr:transcriptional regulator [Cyclobacterium salsum]